MSKLSKLTEEEMEILKQVYEFQSKRKFKYGKPVRWLRGDTKVVEKLKKRGIVWILKKCYYKKDGSRCYKYVFLTKEGRALCEKIFGGA